MKYLAIRATTSSLLMDAPAEAIVVIDYNEALEAMFKDAINLYSHSTERNICSISYDYNALKWCDINLDTLIGFSNNDLIFIRKEEFERLEDECLEQGTLHFYPDKSFIFMAESQDGTIYKSDLITLMELLLLIEVPAK